jgi:hypothetical protein
MSTRVQRQLQTVYRAAKPRFGQKIVERTALRTTPLRGRKTQAARQLAVMMTLKDRCRNR